MERDSSALSNNRSAIGSQPTTSTAAPRTQTSIADSRRTPRRKEEVIIREAGVFLMFSMAQGSVDHRAAQTKDTALP